MVEREKVGKCHLVECVSSHKAEHVQSYLLKKPTMVSEHDLKL